MALEFATYISGLVSANPASGDAVGQADDHLRLIKTTLLNTFPSITGAVTATHTELNQLAGVTVVTTTGTQTLTNKTLTTPAINNPTLTGSGGALTLPAGPDTLVGRATTDTLTNKTLTSPTISGGTINNAVIGGTTPAAGTFTTVSGTHSGDGSGLTNLNGANLQATSVTIAKISATGTRDTTTFLRGDGTFAVPPLGTGTVTSVATSGGLTGGTITGSGTLSINTNNSMGVGAYAILKNTSGTVTDGSTSSGAFLLMTKADSTGAWQTTGVNPSGTWRNVSGTSMGSGDYGMWIRTA